MPISRFDKALVAFWLVLIGFSLFYYFNMALTHLPHFDGALNLDVARSLAETGRYGRFYQSFRLFPIETQTNGPLVIPTAFLYRLFGVSIVTSQLVNLFYLLGFVAMTFVLVRRLTSWRWGLVAVFLVLNTPGVSEFAMRGYGEIPALFWFLIATLGLIAALDRPNPGNLVLGCGVALGLSVLTKTVAMIWTIPVTGLFVLLALFRRQPMQALHLLVGISVPLVAWELYRLHQLNTLTAWVQWWQAQLVEILSQSGASTQLADTIGLWPKLLRHLSILADNTGLPVPVLVAWLVVPQLLAGWKIVQFWHHKKYPAIFGWLAISGVALAYFLWWLTITPTEQAWLRRVMNGLVLQQITAVLALSSLNLQFKAPINKLRLLSYGSAMIQATLALWMAATHHVLIPKPGAPYWEANERDAIQAINSLPKDTVIFGLGWYQAPVLSLFSGRPFYDLFAWPIDRVNQLPHKVLVLDHYVMAPGQTYAKDTLDRSIWRPIFTAPVAAVHELLQVGLSGPALQQGPLLGDVDLSQTEYGWLQGFYDHEPAGLRWSSGVSSITLFRQTQAQLRVKITVPKVAGFLTKEPTVIFRVATDECELGQQAIPAPGDYEFTFALSCAALPSDGPVRLLLSLNSAMRPEDAAPDIRTLSFALRHIGFY